MRKGKRKTENVCGDCEFGIGWPGPEGDHWNVTPDGRPITLHCHRHGTIKRGIFQTDEACTYFKRKI